jgi:hypothetical protein
MARVITFDPVVITAERSSATEAYAPVTDYPVTAPDSDAAPPAGVANGAGADVLDYSVLAEPQAPAADASPPEVASDVDVFRVTSTAEESDPTPPPPPPEVVEGGDDRPDGYGNVLDDRALLSAGTAPGAAALTGALPLDGQTADGWFLEHRLRPADQQMIDRQPATPAYADVLRGVRGPLLASADAAFAPALAAPAPGAEGAAPARPGPAPPVDPGERVTVTRETDAAGNPTAAEVQLDNPDECYVAWSHVKTCGVAAGEGLSVRSRGLPLYRRPRRQSSLRTYDRQGLNGGATDFRQTDIRWNADKVAQALDYIKRTVDAGLPAYIGVNEGGKRTNKIDPVTRQEDPARGLANDGVTDHFLLITGYRTEIRGDRWQLTALSAVDNAAGGGQEGRYPRFTVDADGSVIKPATPGRENEAAIYREYQLSQVWVYERDEPTVRNQSAWSP